MSRRERFMAIMTDAADGGGYLPAGPQNRSDCKVLVKRGLLEPNGCMGYRLTKRALAEFAGELVVDGADYDERHGWVIKPSEPAAATD